MKKFFNVTALISFFFFSSLSFASEKTCVQVLCDSGVWFPESVFIDKDSKLNLIYEEQTIKFENKNCRISSFDYCY
jgi:hypothetical protein